MEARQRSGQRPVLQLRPERTSSPSSSARSREADGYFRAVYQGLTAESSGPLDPIAGNAFDCAAYPGRTALELFTLRSRPQVDRAVGPDQLLPQPECG